MKYSLIWEEIRSNINKKEISVKHIVEKNVFFSDLSSGKISDYLSISDFRNTLTIGIRNDSFGECVLKVHGIPVSLLNTIRRLIIGECISMAIEKVFFFDNSSVIPDEVIVHRLGLIPIKFPPDFLDYFSEIERDHEHKFILEISKSLNESHSKNRSVFSRSLKIRNYGLSFSTVKNQSIKPAYKDILVLKLNPGQKLKCECHCNISCGLDNSKYSPVAATFYRISPMIKVIGETCVNLSEKIFTLCPVRVFDVVNEKRSIQKKLIVSSPQFCTLCNECVNTKDKNMFLVKVGRIKSKLTFVIESSGVMAAENLFHRAIQLLVGKCGSSLIQLHTRFSSIGNKYSSFSG